MRQPRIGRVTRKIAVAFRFHFVIPRPLDWYQNLEGGPEATASRGSLAPSRTTYRVQSATDRRASNPCPAAQHSPPTGQECQSQSALHCPIQALHEVRYPSNDIEYLHLCDPWVKAGTDNGQRPLGRFWRTKAEHGWLIRKRLFLFPLSASIYVVYDRKLK